MIEFNPKIGGASGPAGVPAQPASGSGNGGGFAKAVGNYLNRVDELNKASDSEVRDLLAGKNQDINSVVMAAAKADASFKLLVGVRNKLIEAYKQTMSMQV